MTASHDDLQRWIDAGLIDRATADRILVFEAERSRERRADLGRPGVQELLIYLAAAITGAGFTVLAATNWEHLSSPARVAIPGLSAGAVLASGYWLARIRNDALARGASLLWLVGGALVVGTVAIAAREGGLSENDTALAAGVTAMIVSVALWIPSRTHPQLAGIGAAELLFSTAVSARAAEDWNIAVLGALLAALGVVMLIASERNVLVPRSSARLLAAVALTVGAFWSGLPPSPAFLELLALVVVAALVTAGMRFQSLVYVAFGVLTAFAAMLTLILRHVESQTLAGLALIAIGLILLLAITGLYRTQPWSRWGGPPRGAAPDGR